MTMVGAVLCELTPAVRPGAAKVAALPTAPTVPALLAAKGLMELRASPILPSTSGTLIFPSQSMTDLMASTTLSKARCTASTGFITASMVLFAELFSQSHTAATADLMVSQIVMMVLI